MNLIKYIFFISTFAFTINVNAQSLVPTSSGELIKHTFYELSYSEVHEQAEWVFYSLKPENITPETERTNDFRIDTSVKTGSATKADYYKSGYDRGHLCPAADMKLNKKAMSESFYLSNMSPQKPYFNRGIWKKLESKVRGWAFDEKMLYVVTGPIFENNMGTIGKNNVTIPGYYYKVIYDPTGTEKMIALILPNEKSSEDLSNFVTSVDKVEKLTGIDFFPGLEDNLESQLENKSDYNLWR